MTVPTLILNDLQQHGIAIEVMYDVTARARNKAASLDQRKAAALLREAAIEQGCRGNLRAAQLLDEWPEEMARPAEERY